MALKLNHQTEAQFMERFKARYESADKMEQARLSAWLSTAIKVGDVKTADISTTFGLDVVNATAFISKIEEVATALAIVKDRRSGNSISHCKRGIT